MTPAIMLSFVIPAVVAVTLTVLLIKERDYLFNRKNSYKHQENDVSEEDPPKNQQENDRNEPEYIDYSGGLMGL